MLFHLPRRRGERERERERGREMGGLGVKLEEREGRGEHGGIGSKALQICRCDPVSRRSSG